MSPSSDLPSTQSQHRLNKNRLTNLSTLPHPISQTWELTIPIPHWILAFFHIEGGLSISRIIQYVCLLWEGKTSLRKSAP